MTTKKTQYLLILTLVILSSCNTHEKTTTLKSDTTIENKFEQLTHLVLTDTATIVFRLDTLTNFSWDTVAILTPYSPIDKLESEIKIDLTEIKNTKITSDEVSNVLAFIKGGQLINYVDLSRDKGDFSEIPDSNKVFTKDNCVFELVWSDNKFASGQTIIKVKPRQHN